MQLDRLAAARKAAKMTATEVAERLGISPSYYSLLERGKRRLHLDTALKIACILKKNPSEIFLPSEFTDSKPKQQEGDSVVKAGRNQAQEKNFHDTAS